jgi:iron complex transport system permease protein
MRKNNQKIFILFGILSVVAVIGYLTVWMISKQSLIREMYSDPSLRDVLFTIIGDIAKERFVKVLAIVVAAVLVAHTSLVFQTMTNNRILTPSILGFDAIYAITQTLIIFLLGSISLLIQNPFINFFINTVIMVLIVMMMYALVFRKNKNNIVLLLLVGMIITSLARSIVNFLQVLMDPNEYQSVQALTSVSIVNIDTKLVLWVLPVMIVMVGYFISRSRIYDVIQLGETSAINLGVSYQKETRLDLIMIAISIAISTALVGPLSFLGLIVVNSARELLKTYKHLPLFILSSLIAIVFLVFGQVIIELTGYQTTVVTLISFAGGIYMIYLILKENKL